MARYSYLSKPPKQGSFWRSELQHRCIMLFGFGLYEHSPAILLFALPWLLFAHLFVILYEEPHLRATFGAPYDEYCRSVRRWLSRIWAPSS